MDCMTGVILQIPQAGCSVRKRMKLPRLGRGQGSSSHERRVAQIAMRLFDLLAPQHKLGPKYREILRLGALLHDAGRHFGAADHHLTGAELVLADRRLRLARRTRRCVAYLVRYHRGNVPARSETQILLPGDRHRKLRILLGLLRAADGLDSRRASPTAIVMKQKSHRLSVRCLVGNDRAHARKKLGQSRKFRLLERSLKLTVSVRVDSILPEGAAAAA